MRHDDLRIDCPRKGNRDDGNPACLACPSHAHSDGKALTEDGKWGAKSQAAYNNMIADYSTPAPAETNPITTDDAATVLMHGIRITITKDGANQ